MAAVIGQLAALRPLVEDGSLLFTDHVDFWRGIHPSRQSGYRDAIRSVAQNLWDVGELSVDDIEDQLIFGMAGTLVAVQQQKASPLALSRNEQLVLDAVLTGHMIDSRPTGLRKLVSLSVPDFSDNPRELIALRQSSDSLHEFRLALDDALTALADVPDTPDAATEAAAVVADVLAGRLQPVAREAERAPFATATRSFGRQLSFAALGAATGAAVLGAAGMPAVGALAGAASTTVVNGADRIRGLLTDVKSRRDSKAVWEVVTSFRPN